MVDDAATAIRAATAARLVEGWLDALDADGRWALLKLVTGGLRIGVSARLAKQALAEFGDVAVDEIEEVWHGLTAALRRAVRLAGRPRERAGRRRAAAPFRPVMLAHADR